MQQTMNLSQFMGLRYLTKLIGLPHRNDDVCGVNLSKQEFFDLNAEQQRESQCEHARNQRECSRNGAGTGEIFYSCIESGQCSGRGPDKLRIRLICRL